MKTEPTSPAPSPATLEVREKVKARYREMIAELNDSSDECLSCHDGLKIMALEDELQRKTAALEEIASYDASSRHGEGTCGYGCDCPNIARKALQSEQPGAGA